MRPDLPTRPLEDDGVDPLLIAAMRVENAEQQLASAVIDAALAGRSQRDIHSAAGLSMHAIRTILRDAGIVYDGPRYRLEKTDG